MHEYYARRLKPCYFSDLTEEQLMSSFGEVPKFRFVLSKVFLSYDIDDTKSRRIIKDHGGYLYTYDLPKDTAHGTLVGSGHQLFGSIQAARFSLDPASPPFSIFNHKYNDPIAVSNLGCLSPSCICYCSIPFSTSVKIAAKLYVSTDAVADVSTGAEYWSCLRATSNNINDAFEICNASEVLDFSDYFAKRPNGGSRYHQLKGRDGHLKLYYLALKYAVDAALEVVFVATSKETRVAGRIMAYYGKNFDYGCSPAEVDDYKAMLFETEEPEVKPGRINLVRSVLSVPAQCSLIIDANLTDSTSGAIILSGVYEFLVPTDGGIRVGRIEGNDCSLNLKVDWKLPPFAAETTLDKRSYYSDLTKEQVFSQRSLVTENGRWSLQKEFSLVFGCLLNGAFPCGHKAGISISTGTEGDDYDYLCTSVLNIWPEIRRVSYIPGPKRAGLQFKQAIYLLPKPDMMERCVVGGPGLLKFTLSRTWIAERIYDMIGEKNSLAWAPKLPIKTTIIQILPRSLDTEMHMGHLQSAIIGETLARVLAHSEVTVHQRLCCGDYLDTESKMMMTEFLIDSFPNGEFNDQAIGELEVFYEESKKRFVEDYEFRERTQLVQDWDERHKSAWEQICKISRKRYCEVYQRLEFCVKEEGKTLHDYYIGEARKLLREKGYNTISKGDEVIVIEGRKLRLVDFAALWHALEKGADRIVHVADVGQQDKIEMCITAAESVGYHCHDLLSHVGFVQVEGFEGFGLAQLLDEAKSRSKAFLVGKKAGKELEHASEALGYGAVKYEVLKNNRLTDYTLSFDNMLKETGNTAVYLQLTHARICSSMGKSKSISALVDTLLTRKDCITLKEDLERELGLHLLRYPEVLGEVCRVLAPHILCDYVFVLCDKFNGLYADGQVIREDVVFQPDDICKYMLFETTRMVLVRCFSFFGIEPIDEM